MAGVAGEAAGVVARCATGGMETVLAGFVRALRAAGAESSTAEALDAARAVALLGYASRADLKAALGLALAKSESDRLVHDRVFDLYFSAPRLAGEGALGPTGAAQAVPPTAAAPAPAAGAPTAAACAGQAAGQPADRLQGLAAGYGPQASEAAATDLQLALSHAAAAAGIDGISLFTQAVELTRRMLQALGIEELDARLLQLLQSDSSAAQAQAQALQATRATLQRAARAYVDRAFELYGRPATEAFMTEVAVHRPLGRVAPEEMARMQAAVRRMARRLAERHGRRQRAQRRGRLDMRRTLRANAGHGGMPFDLHFRHRRREQPRLVVVCDVSGSVAAQVRFLLLFLYALHGVVGELRSFAFSNRLQEVSALLEQLPFDDAIALILKEVGMGSTDYGRAWSDLHERHLDAIDRRTTLLVLGDGRSNGTPPRLDLFADLAQRAKRVVWLCPEPPGRWGSGDSALLRYRPWCPALTHCATVADLERAIDDTLSAYQ